MPSIYRANIPQYNENRGGHNPPPNTSPKHTNKKKKGFKELKCNTIQSLNDVEYFLNNINYFAKCFKIYKICKHK